MYANFWDLKRSTWPSTFRANANRPHIFSIILWHVRQVKFNPSFSSARILSRRSPSNRTLGTVRPSVHPFHFAAHPVRHALLASPLDACTELRAGKHCLTCDQLDPTVFSFLPISVDFQFQRPWKMRCRFRRERFIVYCSLFPREVTSVVTLASQRYISLTQMTFRGDEDDSAMFIMFGERRSSLILSYLLFVVLGCLVTVSNQLCSKNTDCKNGYCTSDKCICNPGWWGSLCQFCRLR